MAVESVKTFNVFSNKVNFKQSQLQKQTNNTNVQPRAKKNTSSKNKTPVVAGAIVLAALGAGIYAHKTGILKKSAGTIDTKKILDKINKIKNDCMDELNKVIKDNTAMDEIKLDVIDSAAGMRSADKFQPERFHQAATWVEEAYKRAYSRAKLSDGNNMLNYIHNRVNKENTTLAQMYVQMPEVEANVRMKEFAKEVASMDKHTGMTAEQFVKDMKEVFMPKAKKELFL